jgi:hypothetical protein
LQQFQINSCQLIKKFKDKKKKERKKKKRKKKEKKKKGRNRRRDRRRRRGGGRRRRKKKKCTYTFTVFTSCDFHEVPQLYNYHMIQSQNIIQRTSAIAQKTQLCQLY